MGAPLAAASAAVKLSHDGLGFFDLPGELRVVIYEHLLLRRPERGEEEEEGRRPCIQVRHKPALASQLFTVCVSVEGGRPPQSCFLLCQQFKNEFEAVLYSPEKEFDVDLRLEEGLPHQRRWLHDDAAFFSRTARCNISLSIRQYRTGPNWLMFRALEDLLGCFGGNSTLRSMRVTLTSERLPRHLGGRAVWPFAHETLAAMGQSLPRQMRRCGGLGCLKSLELVAIGAGDASNPEAQTNASIKLIEDGEWELDDAARFSRFMENWGLFSGAA